MMQLRFIIMKLHSLKHINGIKCNLHMRLLNEEKKYSLFRQSNRFIVCLSTEKRAYTYSIQAKGDHRSL